MLRPVIAEAAQRVGGPGDIPAGDAGRRRLGTVLVSSFARWAGGPGHPDL